jgi:hypothetical protein
MSFAASRLAAEVFLSPIVRACIGHNVTFPSWTPINSFKAIEPSGLQRPNAVT